MNEQKQFFLQNYILFCIDLVCVCASYFLAIITRKIIPDFVKDTKYYFLVLSFIVILCLLSYVLFRWNTNFLTRGSYAEVFYVVKYDVFMGAGLGLFLFMTQKAQDFSRLAFAYFLIYNFVFTYILHLFTKHVINKIYMNSQSRLKMLVITEQRFLSDLFPEISTQPEWGHEVTGLALIDNDYSNETFYDIPVIANKQSLYSCLNEFVVDEILIYLPESSNKQIGSMIRKYELAGIVVHVIVDPYNHITSHPFSGQFSGHSIMTYTISDFDFHRFLTKRIFDIFFAIIGLIITAVLTPFIALAIKMDSPGPVFYKQTRVGLNGRKFQIYKFRSMKVDADLEKDNLMKDNEMSGPIFKLSDDPRVTKVGKFLRRTSIDELPQFYNILIGNMSLIGTRPPTEDEYLQYKTAYRRRLSIKPGLTGLWQVSGRNKITDFEEILRLDLHYIDHWSLGMDIKILFQTIIVIFNKKGAK